LINIDIIDASLIPAITIALTAGFLSFLSPCVLPIVPPYLAYMSGLSIAEMTADQNGRYRSTITALFFVLGLSTVFIFLGFAASTFGTFFLQNQVWFSQISGLIIIIIGLHFLNVFRIKFLDREARMDAGERGGTSLGAYILGLAFAFGWTPCIGPQLGAILTIAASEGSVVRGTFLLGIYAVYA
jgi:cytochrome c-type biogenesis protein